MKEQSAFQRIIGKHRGEQPGSLVVCLAGIHGNEKAGIFALQRVFKWLEQNNPQFKGGLVGIAGNLTALNQGKRFIDRDLNRSWDPESVRRIRETPMSELHVVEDREQKELIRFLDKYEGWSNENKLFIDLHTTSAFGGLFTIANEVTRSGIFAQNLYVPVLTGLDDVLVGTTLQHFNERNLTGIGFEAGQHDDPRSIENIVAAILICLVGMGNMKSNQIPDYKEHHMRLHKYGIGLPDIVKFRYRHRVKPQDHFIMKEGYKNFQEVYAGEVLAFDVNGEVQAPESGMILMPLYQKIGEDGFFIVEPIEF